MSDELYDSDDLFESDEDVAIPEVDINTEFRQLSLEDFNSLVNEVLRNEKIVDATVLVYQVFNNILIKSIRLKSFYNEYPALLILSSCVKKLKYANKFSSVVFANYITSDFLEVPLEVIWWLQKNDIMYMAEFRQCLQDIHMVDDLLYILKRKEDNEVFISSQIVQDIIVELIRGCHRPNVGIYDLHISSVWATYCIEAIKQLVNHIFTDVINDVGDGSVNFLPLIRRSRKYLPSVVIQWFFKSILLKFMTHNVKEFSLYSSYTYQELWCSQRIPHNLKIVYEEIFCVSCNMQVIVDIVEELDSEVNWKFTMAAVGVCAHISSSGLTNVKDIALQYLNSSLKGGKIALFVKGLLFIRQACLEFTNFGYKLWYAQTFGLRNDYKATRHISFFKFFIRSFTKLIPYEPKSYLKEQIEHVMFVPPTCNSIMHDYKNMCRARLEELKKSPSVITHGCEVVVLHMMEETAQTNKISRILIDIITNQRSDFYDTVVPQVLAENPICKTVKELLVAEKYLSNNLLQSSNIYTLNNIFEDDDDIFVNIT